MPNYQEGRIYVIRCRTDDTLIYVGSTTQPLAVRWGGHKRNSRTEKQKNRLIYKTINGNWKDWYIELFEECPCENKEQLCRREGEIIREIGTLNSKISGITQQESSKLSYEKHREEIIEASRQYRINNPDKVRLTEKIYYENHREEILEASRQYHKKNKEARNEYSRKYREEHKEEIAAKKLAKGKEYINMKRREYYAKKQAKKTDIQPLNPV
jgi:hypothetical protein